MNEKINYIEFSARDLLATQKFFSETFGWSFKDYGPDYCSFSNSGVKGGFYRSDLSSKVKDGGVLVVLYAENLEETEARVVENGGKIVKPIFAFPGGRRFHFQEPGGNELAVWSEK